MSARHRKFTVASPNVPAGTALGARGIGRACRGASLLWDSVMRGRRLNLVVFSRRPTPALELDLK